MSLFHKCNHCTFCLKCARNACLDSPNSVSILKTKNYVSYFCKNCGNQLDRLNLHGIHVEFRQKFNSAFNFTKIKEFLKSDEFKEQSNRLINEDSETDKYIKSMSKYDRDAMQQHYNI